KRGWRACRLSQSRPSLRRAEGRNDASNKSAPPTSSSNFPRCAESLRSRLTTVCPWQSESYHARAEALRGSPAGGSTLVMPAPNRARWAAATGPGALIPKETILIPCNRTDWDVLFMVIKTKPGGLPGLSSELLLSYLSTCITSTPQE